MTSLVRSGLRECRTLWSSRTQPGGIQWALVSRLRSLLAEPGARGDESAAPEGSPGTQLADETHAFVSPHEVDVLRARIATLENQLLHERWAETAPLHRQPLVSVVLATRGERPVLLEGSINSILTQSYKQFELLIIAPTGVPLPPQFQHDDRVRLLPCDGTVGAARNLGIEGARGEFITYADDDNIMAPNWIRAIVTAFAAGSDIDVVYGKRLHEALHGAVVGDPGFWHFAETWDPEILLNHSPIDTAVLGHRAGLEAARWDEELPGCLDWDLAIRLTADGRVQPIPVHACTYGTTAAGRITGSYGQDTIDIVRSRAEMAQKPKCLAISHCFPRFSETYMESELAALSTRFNVVFASEGSAQQGATSAFRGAGTIEEAIQSERPDVVFSHFIDVAVRNQPLLTEHGLPYLVRQHSYDYRDLSVFPLTQDPFCLGVWAFPNATMTADPKVHLLAALIHDAHLRPIWQQRRAGVVLATSCLPKRHWKEIGEVFALIDPVPRTLFIGTTQGHEDLPDTVRQQLGEIDPGATVVSDVPVQRVMQALVGANSLLYALASTHPVGNPRSVIEAWICGAVPVMPDTSESRQFAGEFARYYRTPHDAREHILDIENAGTALDEQRRHANAQALERFADPAILDGFADQAFEAFTAFRTRKPQRVSVT